MQPWKKQLEGCSKKCGISQYLETFFHSCFGLDVGLSRRRACMRAFAPGTNETGYFYNELNFLNIWCALHLNHVYMIVAM